MGRLPQGAFQGFIGKTGGLVGKRWKGLYTVSAYQPNVANPKSTNQQIQRNIFKNAVLDVHNQIQNGLRESISVGFSETTMLASNVGLAVTLDRAAYLANNTIPNNKLLSAIPTGIMMRGLDNCGNNCFDNPTIVQTGTTSVFTISFDPEPGLKYFGSDIALDGLKALFCASDGTKTIYTEVDLSVLNSEVDPTVEKTYGFQGSADMCGNWAFVYKISTSNLVASFSGVALATTYQGKLVNEAFVTYGFYVPYGTVFSSKNVYKELTVV